jgi:hypothetical protein
VTMTTSSKGLAVTSTLPLVCHVPPIRDVREWPCIRDNISVACMASADRCSALPVPTSIGSVVCQMQHMKKKRTVLFRPPALTRAAHRVILCT